MIALSLPCSLSKMGTAEYNSSPCSGNYIHLHLTVLCLANSDCVPLPCIPTGTWYCKYCQNLFQKEKFVEHNANAVAAGRVAGVDPIEQITTRCIRIVKTMEVEVGGCALCRFLFLP